MEQNQGLPDDFAAQEAAARTWEPEVEGPLLGDKTTITAITEQYAKADPVYVDKTIALPQTYSHYRPVRGDGNCGWRAIGFCYFELLIQQGSQELVDGECLRLTQLNDYLVNSGNYDPDLFVDFVEDTFELLKQISANIHDHDTAMAVLTTKFNDLSSMNILFHLRLLAGAWLRGNRDQFAGWCEADPETYAQTMIEPAQREIEELGVVLLVEVLLKPAGFTLEIAYLDRSQGSQVNTHRFPDGDPNNLGPFIYLLYRPDSTVAADSATDAVDAWPLDDPRDPV
ncbi:putative ubiquitin thioesterase [Diaporthe ampelina]|uniref:ubiquitinyl hydrolase 1 n=1 Tax=Diaporthe ampelina TaxID=1214573 RepID=A0A0G2FRW3_9PEZI|nr:putative ubiquitin thioesterase [Diaporthe ampelina]